MRIPENSPGSPAQWPAVSTSFGAMIVPEQRNAGCPATSMMMRTTAGWASPSTAPSVMNDGPPGFRAAVGTRSQLSRLMQAAARTGMTTRAFMVPRGWDGGCDCNAERVDWPEYPVKIARYLGSPRHEHLAWFTLFEQPARRVGCSPAPQPGGRAVAFPHPKAFRPVDPTRRRGGPEAHPRLSDGSVVARCCGAAGPPLACPGVDGTEGKDRARPSRRAAR